MFSSLRASVLLASLALAIQVRAIPKITRVGRYLYDDSGARFYIKGVAYQEQGEVEQSEDNPFGEPSTFVDPLALPAACERDLPHLKQLGVNTLRVYSVDSAQNHDECMKLFSDNNIYTIIDLALPLNGSIDRLAPSWSTNILDQYLRTIDTFSKYDNVLGYNVGNEVVVQETTDVAPYVKAAARDVKAYLKSIKSDALVGYAAINGGPWRNTLANFLSCGSEETSIDLYGLNDYSWCGESSFSASYSGTARQFADYNVVAYLSEFGCLNNGAARPWTEVASIFSSDMSPVWSGGIAFSYFHAVSAQGEFGMVEISADGRTVTTSTDFDNLASQYSAATGPNTPARSSVAASTYPTCPTADGSTWLASNTLPPTPNDAACNCLNDAVSCQFTNLRGNYTKVVGELLDYGCQQLGQLGASCTEIGGDGATGVYGRLAGCDPTIKLSYVMSQFYEGNNRAANACSFAGNGTINQAPAATQSAAAVASSCIANPSATFAPSSPPTTAGGASSTRGPNNNNNNNAAMSIFADSSLIGVGSVALLAFGSAVLTLL